jgi:hypothetical protein
MEASPADQQMEEQQQRTVGLLDDMRMKGREALKRSSLSGLPPELHWRVVDLVTYIEEVETAVSGYVSAAKENATEE